MHLKDEKARQKSCITFRHYLRITCDIYIDVSHAIPTAILSIKFFLIFNNYPTTKMNIIIGKPHDIHQ